MIISISGAGGFLGKQIWRHLAEQGHQARAISRITADTPEQQVADNLQGTDVVINLAGAPILARWTQEYKKVLFDSRIMTTRKIVEAIKLMDKKPELLISASAVGIYSSKGVQTENNFQVADDFLGFICKSWEAEAKKAIPDVRVAIIRLGVVLGKEGGALQRMLLLFRWGLGGKIGSGRHGFSWVHLSDVLLSVQYIISNRAISGEFNLTAPEGIDNETFTRTLSSLLKRPAFFTIPAWALKLVFGEGSIALTGGQFAPPKHLLDVGFRFGFPDLKSALKEIIG